MKQKTISRSFSLEGLGIHSGKMCCANFYPAEPNSGICFVVDGVPNKVSISMAVSTIRGTTLEIAGKKIAVVEHVLSAVSGIELDNLKIELEGNEMPAMDGSALPFAEKLLEAGIKEQDKDKNFLVPRKEIEMKDGDKFVRAIPYNGFAISFMVNFAGFGEQKLEIELDPDAYIKEIAPARTFGYLSELEELKKKGLGLGASLSNALALDGSKYVNQPRFPDELVRHKILDLIGDLGLLNQPLKAKIFANMSGHKLNIALAKKICSLRDKGTCE